MRPAYITDDFLRQFVTAALAEDVGDGDHSTLASIPADARKTAKLLVKDNGILAGVALAKEVFRLVEDDLQMRIFINDGEKIQHGDVAFSVTGAARTILTLERLVLNCMQRMSAFEDRRPLI